MSVVSLAEHRALRTQQDADLDYQPCSPEENLFACRALLAHLEGYAHVEPDHEDTQCTDCAHNVAVAFTHGQATVCRGCRRHRLRAMTKADADLPAYHNQPDLAAELAAKAERWVRNVTPGQPLDYIERALRNTGLPPTDLYRLVDLAADLATTAAGATLPADDHALEQPQPLGRS